MNSASSSSCCCATDTSWPAGGCCAFVFCHAASGSPPLTRDATRRNSSCVCAQLAQGDLEQSIGADSQAFIELELLLELLPPEPEAALAARRQIGLEILDVAPDRCRRFGRGVGEIAEDVEIVERREGAGQIVVDEPQRAAQALEPDLDEDPGRVLDVVAGRLHQPRHLAQLRQHPARSLGERRVVEERLAGQARRQRIGEELRAALPGPNRFQFEDAGADARFERRPFEALDVGQAGRVDRGQAAAEAPQRPDLGVNRLTTEVLQEVVVHVHAVEGCGGRIDLVEIREVFVNEVGKGFG